MNNAPSDSLKARGIDKQALLAGWVETANYWVYKIIAPDGSIIAHRMKRYPHADASIHKAKYLWQNGKPENLDAQWYIQSDTKQAIEAARNVAYLSNGEPAMLAYREAGILNALATTLSEVAVPKEAVSYLRRMGIGRLIYIVDKDAAGLKSAQNWHDELAGTGIDLELRQWPSYLAEKADGNDAWIAAEFLPQAFALLLKDTSLLSVTTTEAKAPKKVIQGEIDNRNLVSALRSALENGGYLERKIYQGVFQECHCPFHEDKESSAGFSIESGVINCMGKCGRAFSPYEVAERLGLNWRDYSPKQEKPKKVKPVRQSVTAIETVTETQVMSSEMVMPEMYAVAAYPAGQYTGWINQEWLPMSWNRAMLTLCHSKSATVVYAMRFHRAVRTAKIDPEDFTLDELMHVLGSRDKDGIWRKAPRKSTQNFVDTMNAWGFFRILATMYLDTNKATKSGNNLGGRPKIHYAIIAHTETLRYRLAELLEPALLEILTDEELAPRSPAFRDSLDLSFDEYRIWHERTSNPRHDWILKQISDRVCDVLENDFALEFTDFELEHPANLRGKLLRMELAPYSRDKDDNDGLEGVGIREKGIQLSRGKLAMQLGCSESSMSKLYKDNHVGVKRMRGFVEVENPNNCDILAELREAPMRLNKELGGFTVGIKLKVFKPYAEKAVYLEHIFYGESAIGAFKKWDGHIEKLYVFVEQPSLLWLMNEAEIAQKAALEAKEDTPTEDETETLEVPKVEEEKTEKKERKKSLITGKDRAYVGLSPEFQSEQFQLETHMYTPYKLVGMTVTGADDSAIYTAQTGNDLVMWLNRNASKKAIRSQYSFYSGVEDMPKESKAVIFYIHCDILNKTYIGSSNDIQADIKAEFATLGRKKHSCKALQAAFNEFGRDSLQWGVLEEPDTEFVEGSLEYWRRKAGEEKPFAIFNPIID